MNIQEQIIQLLKEHEYTPTLFRNNIIFDNFEIWFHPYCLRITRYSTSTGLPTSETNLQHNDPDFQTKLLRALNDQTTPHQTTNRSRL